MAKALLLHHHYKPSLSISAAVAKQSGAKVASGDWSVLVLGGTGRAGGSTAAALSKLCPSLRLIIGGRNREKGDAVVNSLGGKAEFIKIDIENAHTLERALEGVDLVVHAAGPFQQEKECSVLEAAISTRTAYVDLCDDLDYASRAKTFHAKALAAGVPALTTAGLSPGVSNVMAAELVRCAKTENAGTPKTLRFSYYIAGSGGAGPTVLAASFLLLGEDVIVYNKGEKIKLRPYSGVLNIDFGKGIGRRDVYLLNLPEVRSAHEILGVPTVSARFGTAPSFWNLGMEGVAKHVPAETLRDGHKIRLLVQLFDPVVRAIDAVVGQHVSMRVDLEWSNGQNTLGLFTHENLTMSAGQSTAAFALAVLEGSSQPGVWFPEEPEGIAVEARKLLLERASEGAMQFVMNESPWM